MEVIGKMDTGHGTHELLLVTQAELHTLILAPNPTLTLTVTLTLTLGLLYERLLE